jgi:lysozyme
MLLLSQFIITGGLAYYFSFKSDKVLGKKARPNISDVRNHQVLENMREKYRFDVSEYQGRIRWSYVDTLEKKIPIAFCVYSATVGKIGKISI